MSTLKLKALLLSTMAVSTAFAMSSNEADSSAFHRQNLNNSYAQPQPESNYFAMLAKTPSKLRSYVGLGVGIDISNLQPTVLTGGGYVDTLGSNALKGSFAGDIYGGIGTNFNSFYIGTELSAGGNFLKRKFTSKEDKSFIFTVQKPATVGLDLIPGFLSPEQNFLFYGRIGVGANWFTAKIDGIDSVDGINNSKYSKTNLALRAGIGMEYFMGESVSLRLDYIFSNSNDIKKNYIDPNIDPKTKVAFGASSYKIPSLYDHKITIGLTYNF